MSGELKSKESRKEQIFKTATRIFCEKTYHGTTLEDIADAVGILKGSLYHYITSKEQLLSDIILDTTHALLESLMRVESADLDPVERLRQIVVEHVRFNTQYREAGTLYITDKSAISVSNMKEVSDIFQRRDKLLARTLKEGIKMGLFEPVDIRVTSLAIVGLCNSLLFWYRPAGRFTWEEIADSFFSLIYHGLKARRAD